MNHLVGSTVIIRLTVRDENGDLAAATVDLVIQDPSGNESIEVPTNPSLGVYEYALDLDEVGWWTAIWTATVGSLTEVIECTVCAKESVLVGSA
jgi:hypothetical protein